MVIDTLNSRNQGDVSGVQMWTPPSGGQAIPAFALGGGLQHQELLVDVSCLDALRATLRDAPFKVVRIDLARMLANGTASNLSSATAIVMAPQLTESLTAIDAIDQLRAMVPHVGLYVAARSTADVAHDLPRLAAVGVDEVFCLDTRSDGDAFAETLSLRLAAPAPETEIRLLWKWFRDSRERSLVMHCVRNGYRFDVWSIRSRVFGACRKTLQNRMTVVGLPSPGIVARCGRVLHVQELERRGVKPTTAISAILGFPSPGAMQRARRRLRKALMARGRQALVFASLIK